MTADDAPATIEDFIDANEGDGNFSIAASLDPAADAGARVQLADRRGDRRDLQRRGELGQRRLAQRLPVPRRPEGCRRHRERRAAGRPGRQPERRVGVLHPGDWVRSSMRRPACRSASARTRSSRTTSRIGIPGADDAPLEPRSPGIPGKGAVINPKGEHPEEALDFVKWLTEPEQQQVFAEVGRILPTNPELLASGDVPEQLVGFAAGVEIAAGDVHHVHHRRQDRDRRRGAAARAG